MLITKDELYQYVNENDNFSYLNFDNVFSELVSWDFIYKKLSIGNNNKSIVILFGTNVTTLLKGLMYTSFKKAGKENINVNCYNYNSQMGKFTLIESLQEVQIQNDKDIKYVIKQTLNESRNAKHFDNNKVMNLICMNYNKENIASYVIIDIDNMLNDSNENTNGMPFLNQDDIELCLKFLYKMKITYNKNVNVSIIGCIEINDMNCNNNNNNNSLNRDDDSLEIENNNLNSNVLLNVTTLLENDDNHNHNTNNNNIFQYEKDVNTNFENEIQEIDVSPLTVSESQLKLSQSQTTNKKKEHIPKQRNLHYNYNMEYKKRNVKTFSNDNNDSETNKEISQYKSELKLLRKQNQKLEELTKLLETSLKYERKEKMKLLNENNSLKQKMNEIMKQLKK